MWYTPGMKIYLDADGIPCRKDVLECARRYGILVVVVADYSHDIALERGMERITVDTGTDAADIAIVNRIQQGDLVVTQDVGLAALALHKGAAVISPRGYKFTERSVQEGLTVRWLRRKVRAAGGRMRGPRRFSGDDRTRFLVLLQRTINTLIGRSDENR